MRAPRPTRRPAPRCRPATGLRVLFSAHGLPEMIVKAGDPYQFQVERTVAGVVRSLAIAGPGLADLLPVPRHAAEMDRPQHRGRRSSAPPHDKVAVLVVPIAFVSEHSETLVELDVEYRELAEKVGVPGYFRAPAQNSDPGFIAALAELVEARAGRGPGLCSFAGGRTCPRAARRLPARPRRSARPSWPRRL